jgi:hypothetical protein
MLHARAEPRQREQQQQRDEACGAGRNRDERARRHERAEHEQTALAEALREQPGGNLEGGHAARVGRPDEAHLPQRQAKLRRPHREQHVEDLGEAVVHEVHGAGGGQHGARAWGAHGRSSPGAATAFK